MAATDVLEVDRTEVSDRMDSFTLPLEIEPEGKVLAVGALHYKILISKVVFVERIHLVHLVDESFLEVLFSLKSEVFDRINEVDLFLILEAWTYSVRICLWSPHLKLLSLS